MSSQPQPFQRAADVAHEQEIGQIKAHLVGGQDDPLDRLLFGVGKGADADRARDELGRLHLNPRYNEIERHIRFALKKKLGDMFDLARKHLREIQATHKETTARLQELDIAVRHMGILGQAIKLQETPYGSSSGVGEKASLDVLDPSEISILEKIAEYVEKMKPEELTDMVFEDQPLITMLSQTQEQKGQAVIDPLESKFDRKPPTMLEFDSANPEEYQNNLSMLRKFIIGQPIHPKHHEKSRTREMSESTVWLSIVRNMNADQKRDLVAQFFEEGNAAETKNFIDACLLAGVMSEHDVQDMHADLSQDETTAIKLGPDFLPHVGEVMKQREELKKEMSNVSEQIRDGGKINSAVDHYFTFKNAGAVVLLELGRTTILVNFLLDVGDRLRRRGELQEGVIKATVKGVGDALKNKWLWFGIGEVIAGTDAIEPWVKAQILKPSGAEAEATAQKKLQQEFKDTVNNHPPEFADYFARNYETYISAAGKNARMGKAPLIGKQDVKLTDAEAQSMGFGNANAAATQICRMYWISSTVLKNEKLDDENKLLAYFEKNIYPHS